MAYVYDDADNLQEAFLVTPQQFADLEADLPEGWSVSEKGK
jgi:hypothetical protein